MKGLVGDERKRALLRVWCRKKAALKITGIDLTVLSVMRSTWLRARTRA